MIEESLLRRAPSSRGESRAIAEFLDATAFEERLREARMRRARALANRDEAAAAPPTDPRIAWARETTARPGFYWPDKPTSAFVPPFALRDADLARPAPETRGGTAEADAPADRPVPAARARFGLGALAGLGRLAVPRAIDLLGIERLGAFARAHLVPVLASFVVAGIGLGAAVAVFSTDGQAPAPADREVAASAAVPVPGKPEVVERLAAATTAPLASATPAAATIAALPETNQAPSLPDPVTMATDAETGGDLTAGAVAELAPDQIAALEPPAAAAAAPLATTEYFAARPLPRPDLVPAASPGLAATGDASGAATPTASRFAETRVTVNYPAGTQTARLAELTGAIGAAGFPTVRSARVNVDMSAANVRYFHAADAAAARALAEATGATARDFTSFTPAPKTGHLELWLPGTATRRAPAAEDQILGILRTRAALD